MNDAYLQENQRAGRPGRKKATEHLMIITTDDCNYSLSGLKNIETPHAYTLILSCKTPQLQSCKKTFVTAHCLSSLKCDSGVMDNCTATLTTASSIPSLSSFNNVHYYYSHKLAPTNARPCRKYIGSPRSRPLTDKHAGGVSAWPSVCCIANR